MKKEKFRTRFRKKVRAWVEKEFDQKHVDEIIKEIFDVAEGKREGVTYICDMIRRITEELRGEKAKGGR